VTVGAHLLYFICQNIIYSLVGVQCYSVTTPLIDCFFIEVQKLQTHLNLLREEYVKLQRRLVEAEKSYQIAVAGSHDGSDSSGFVTKLLKTVSDLYAKELYRFCSKFYR